MSASADLAPILSKIRKLRALAASANEHEAAAAAGAANRLIEQYRIDEAQLAENTEIGKDRAPLEVFRTVRNAYGETVDAEVVYWKMVLIVGLCDAHGCLSYTGTHKETRDKAVWMVGKGSDMALVRAMYEWLRDEIERLSVERYEENDILDSGYSRPQVCRPQVRRPQVWMESYQLGAVRGCLLAMRTAADEIRAAAATEAARCAIVKLDGRVDEAEKALRDMDGEQPDQVAEEPALDLEAFAQGEEDGREVGQIKKLGGGV